MKLKTLLFAAASMIFSFAASAQVVVGSMTDADQAAYFKSYEGMNVSLVGTYEANGDYYYGKMEQTNNSAYIAVTSDKVLSEVRVLVTGNGNNKTCVPALIGFAEVAETPDFTKADYAVAAEGVEIPTKSYADAKWFSFDLSGKNLKAVYIAKQWKNVVVGDAAKASFPASNAQSFFAYGFAVAVEGQTLPEIPQDTVPVTPVDTVPQDTTPVAPSNNVVLLEALFSNGAKGFITQPTDSTPGAVVVPFLGEKPSFVSGLNEKKEATAQVSVEGDKVVVLNGEAKAEYNLSFQEYSVAPLAVDSPEYVFDGTEIGTWIASVYGWDEAKGIKFAKDVEEESNRRISAGKDRVYFFLPAANKVSLVSGSGQNRPVKITVNGVASDITKTAKTGETITIALPNVPALVAIESNGNSGDAGFTSIRLLSQDTTTTPVDTIPQDTTIIEPVEGTHVVIADYENQIGTFEAKGNCSVDSKRGMKFSSQFQNGKNYYAVTPAEVPNFATGDTIDVTFITTSSVKVGIYNDNNELLIESDPGAGSSTEAKQLIVLPKPSKQLLIARNGGSTLYIPSFKVYAIAERDTVPAQPIDTVPVDTVPQDTTPVAPSNNVVLLEALFSNGAKGFITQPTDSTPGAVVVPFLGEKPSFVSGLNEKKEATAQVSVEGDKVVVVNGEAKAEYALSFQEYSAAPLEIDAPEYVFDGTEIGAWIASVYGWDEGKGIKFSKDVEEESNRRISAGKDRVYFFLPAADSVSLVSGSGQNRPVSITVNGVASEINKTAKTGEAITIALGNAPALLAIESNGSNGDGGFTAIRLLSQDTTTTPVDTIPQDTTIIEPVDGAHEIIADFAGNVGTFTTAGSCIVEKEAMKFGNSFGESVNYFEVAPDKYETFVKGDTINITTYITNSDAAKLAQIAIYNDANELIFKTDTLSGTTEPVSQQFILEGPTTVLRLGRAGNTGIYVPDFVVWANPDRLPTSIDLTEIGAAIMVENSTLNINCENVANIQVYTIDGRLIDSRLTNNYSRTLANGVYVIRVNETAVKTIIK